MEVHGRVEVGHGDPDVVDADQAGDTAQACRWLGHAFGPGHVVVLARVGVLGWGAMRPR